MDLDFWKKKPLGEMSPEEWELLCDGCGLCCLFKLSDEVEVYYTNVACAQLDLAGCRCRCYPHRFEVEPNCIPIDHKTLSKPDLLPATCAYRLLFEGKGLKTWHPLRTGDPQSVIDAGISVGGFALSAKEVDLEDLEDYILEGAINHEPPKD